MTRHRTARIRASRKLRKGFTLIELMVALMLFSVGLLALASTSAVVVRQMGDAGNMSVAATAAQARIERLRTASCTVPQIDSAISRGVAVSWVVTPMTRSAQIDVSVRYNTRRGQRTQSYRSMQPCA